MEVVEDVNKEEENEEGGRVKEVQEGEEGGGGQVEEKEEGFNETMRVNASSLLISPSSPLYCPLP